MAKTFYTDHDIEDMVKRGVQSLVLGDDIVLTELAYEKAGRLGLKLVRQVDTPPSAPVRPYIASETHNVTPPPPTSAPGTSVDTAALKQRIKDTVNARLGNQVDPILLDTIIQRVLNTIEKKQDYAMLFGRVHGTAICTLKYPGLEGVKLLVVQPLNRRLQPVGSLQVAADIVQAGSGDLCVMVRSREAALAMTDVKFVPIDLALVGIVDDLDLRPDGDFDFTLKHGWTQYS